MIVSTSHPAKLGELKRSISMSCGNLWDKFTGAGSDPERGRLGSVAAMLICKGCVPLLVGVKQVGR